MNSYSKLKKTIKECETAYTWCFSEYYENDRLIRYRDNELTDMYNHNFTYIKKHLHKDALQQVFQDEMELNRQEGKNYCRLTMDELPDEQYLTGTFENPEIGSYGRYLLKPAGTFNWKTLGDCEVRKIEDSSMVEDLVLMDMIHDGNTCGEDFCNRRARRRGKVYLSEIPLDSYICYYKGIPAGNCDLFMLNGTAKIEDFAVLPEYQRRGIGTTLLKYLVDTALSKGAEVIYLVADEDDTPKEMYIKLGFEKIDESYSLFWKF